MELTVYGLKPPPLASSSSIIRTENRNDQLPLVCCVTESDCGNCSMLLMSVLLSNLEGIRDEKERRELFRSTAKTLAILDMTVRSIMCRSPVRVWPGG